MSESKCALPPKATFTLYLNKVIRNQSCSPAINGVACEFSYDYNCNTGIGHADLLNIGGTAVTILLNPMGLAGRYGFISDIPPTPVKIKGQTVYIYRVILALYDDGTRTAMLMFGQNGSCIEATDNWKTDESLENAGTPQDQRNITNVKMSDQKAKKLAATAATGSYLFASGHPSQVIALDAVNQPGMQLTLHKLYAIAATGMPTTMNMQFDHVTHASDGTLSVFYEVRSRSRIADFRAGAQVTELEEVISGLPWQGDFTDGEGVDAVTGGLAGVAVKPFTPVNRTVKSTATHIRFIQDENDYNREVEASASGKYNIEGVTISGSTSFLNTLSFSQLSTTLVAEFTSQYDGYDEAATYELTDEAKGMLGDPAKFRGVYGDYFISGGQRQSRFLAVYACTTTSVKSMTEFKASFGGDAPDVFSAEGSARFMQAVNQNSISLSVDLYMEGINSNNQPGGPWTPEKIIEALNWFVQNEVGMNMNAKMRHYSTLAPSYPRTIDIDPDVFVELRQLYVMLWDIRGLYNSLPVYYQKQYKSLFVAFDAGVTAKQSILATDAAARAALMQAGQALYQDLNNVYDRMTFYYLVKAAVGSEPGKNSPIEEGTGQQTWQYGYSSYPQSQAVVIHSTSLNYQDAWHIGWREKTLSFGPDGRYIIVGWQVVSNWQDGTNGQWWKVSDTILMQNQGDVHVKSEYDRGCNWTVNFFFADAADYQFG